MPAWNDFVSSLLGLFLSVGEVFSTVSSDGMLPSLDGRDSDRTANTMVGNAMPLINMMSATGMFIFHLCLFSFHQKDAIASPRSEGVGYLVIIGGREVFSGYRRCA